MGFFSDIFVGILKLLKQFVSSSPRLRELLYDQYNQSEFANLYEHEKMLADSVRINTYKKAIDKLVRPGDVVLDLGTGTGILALFAAQQHAAQVYAIDHSDFIRVAKAIAQHNHFPDIEFIQTNSRDFKPEVKFDCIVHEQMGDYLLNENMVKNLLDLKKRLLKQGGKIIPGKFELYLEPVQLEEPFEVPFVWENKLHGIDFSFLNGQQEILEAYKPAVYLQEWLEARAARHFLCEASPVLSFDLNLLHSETELPRSVKISKPVVRPGSFDSFCLFFKVIFDEEIQFDTSPFSTKTHWGNCFFRVVSRSYTEGDELNYRFIMGDPLDIKTWQVFLT